MSNEDQHIEWKATWRDEYLKWLCGFANAQGGVLEIGRNNKGKVVGLKNPVRLLEELPNKLRDLLGIVADINLQEEKGKSYLRISVEPYPVPISYKGEYHYRSGSTKQILKGAALSRFLLNKTGKCWDGVPVPNVGVSDLDTRAFGNFRERAIRAKRLDLNALEGNDLDLLGKLKLVEVSTSSGQPSCCSTPTLNASSQTQGSRSAISRMSMRCFTTMKYMAACSTRLTGSWICC